MFHKRQIGVVFANQNSLGLNIATRYARQVIFAMTHHWTAEFCNKWKSRPNMGGSLLVWSCLHPCRYRVGYLRRLACNASRKMSVSGTS